MASIRDDANHESKGKIRTRTTLGFITPSIMLVAASMFAALGTAQILPASAQMPETQAPASNATGQQEQNQTSTSSYTTSLEQLRQQARMQQQQQAAMNITEGMRQDAREASNAVIGVLIFYARALDDPNIERIEITDPNATITDVRIPEVPLARVQEILTQNATTVNGVNVINIASPADYLIARALAFKAIESYSEASGLAAATADPLTLQRLADTQQDLNSLLGAIEGRVTYNIPEDIAATVNSEIEQIFGVKTAEAT
jgi:hypothetical protein